MSATKMALAAPEVEVVAKPSRRRFTGEYKRKIVREADGCNTVGAVGALLRREGLYSSHLTTCGVLLEDQARAVTRAATGRSRSRAFLQSATPPWQGSPRKVRSVRA